MTGLVIKRVNFSYSNGLVLKDINITVNSGGMVALLGPNGSGKTTLLKLICGLLKPKNGDIFFSNVNIKELSRRNIARRIAVVPQQFEAPSTFMVSEVVMLGRTPFLKAFTGGRKADYKIVTDVMEMVGISNLQTRRFDELSGGERQKAILAMALAQQPEVLLLDEPTLHLDISHQIQILELAQQLNRTNGITIIAALHDLNLASLYFKRLVLLNHGSLVSEGTPLEVIRKENIESVFGVAIAVTVNTSTGVPNIIINPTSHFRS